MVTFTLTVFAFFLIQNQKEHLLYAKMKEIETLSTLIGHGVTSFMKEGKTKDFHDFLNLFSISEDLLEVRILDAKGSVLHSSRKSEEGTSLASLLPGGTVPGKAPPVFAQELRGHPFLSTIRTFQNEPACFSCHGNQPRTLGILHVSLPMEATSQSLRLNRNLLMASTAITLLLMGLVINLLLTRLVKKPTSRLIETMSQVEQGNLDVRVSLGTQDELGRLAKNFDSMVQKLSTAQKEVERQHQQQMLQVQHLASLGELAASVAHEVRNPLAGIKLAIQILSKEPGLADSHRETMFEIGQSVERLEKTMSDLLLYSRVRPPECRPVSLPEIIEDGLLSLHEEFQQSGIQAQKIFDPALPLLPLDSEQIRRVFLNLFLNALQAMPKGGMLKVETKYLESGGIFQKGLIPPDKSLQGKSWAEITVTDTGEGMPPEVLKEIFRPFFTTKAKGTGLGLSLSRRIVEQHQGRIFAESQTGVGTKFFLLFPIPSPPKGIMDPPGRV